MPKPKDYFHDHVNAKVSLEWEPRFAANFDRVFAPGGELQKRIDAALLEGMEPYLPHDTGMLRNSGIINTVIGSGELVWRTPYARYLYYGILMVDPLYGKGAFHNHETGQFWSRKGVKKIKDPEERKLEFRGGGNRGSHWGERWKNDHIIEFSRNISREAGEMLRR